MWNEPLAPCLTVSFEPFEADAATLIDRVVLSENEIDGFASAAVRAVAVFVTLKPSVGPYPRILDTGCDYAAGRSVAV